MGDNKITIMVLKVDLQSCSCYKKVKNVLCKFPQIRDQVYDEKGNTVTITVVCCNPEKLRDKLCSKGCGVIKSIEIKRPEEPKQPGEPKEPKKANPQAKREKVPETQPVAPPPAPERIMVMPVQEYPAPPHGYCCGECYKGHTGGPCYPLYGRSVPPPSRGYCCGECPEGHTGGPCYRLSGRPVLPPPRGYCCGECSEGHTGGPCYRLYEDPFLHPRVTITTGPGPHGYDSKGCYVSRCEYFNDENATGCSIM